MCRKGNLYFYANKQGEDMYIMGWITSSHFISIILPLFFISSNKRRVLSACFYFYFSLQLFSKHSLVHDPVSACEMQKWIKKYKHKPFTKLSFIFTRKIRNCFMNAWSFARNFINNKSSYVGNNIMRKFIDFFFVNNIYDLISIKLKHYWKIISSYASQLFLNYQFYFYFLPFSFITH